jgi:glycosyltransferase involved in cell wall biosynthesis
MSAGHRLRVLLLSPLRARDPVSGDTAYTEALLAEPPPGVSYTPYDEAIAAGTLRVRGRKPWRHGSGVTDVWVFGVRAIELPLRRSGLAFGEPTWFVSADTGSFDLIHQHLFATRQIGPRLPVVSSAGYPLTELYSAREAWSAFHLRCALAFESATARALDIHEPWLRPTRDGVMVVYTEHFREWLVNRGVDADQVLVAGTALPDRDVPRRRSDGRTLGVIARDFVRKGGDIALAAFRELRVNDQRWRLIVATTASEASVHVKPEPGVELVVDPSREFVLNELLPRIDILLAPTRSDCGAPYAVLESLRAGTCVVMSDNPWLDPRLRPPAVARVPLAPDAVASAVVALVRQDGRARQFAARTLWRSAFVMDQLHQPLLAAYEAAIHRHRA